MNIAIVSGGFDVLHSGHIKLFKGAAKHGRLIVGLNSDDWLLSKKGYVVMPWEQRAEIINELECVDVVMPFSDDESGTCLDLLRYWVNPINPEVGLIDRLSLCNGGDRSPDEDPIPEEQFCIDHGIKLVYGVGDDGKSCSSKSIAQKIITEGFHSTDLVNLYETLTDIILPRLTKFRQITVSCPILLSADEWNKTLDKMIDGFEIISDDNVTDENYSQVEESLGLFAKWYLDLWS